MSRTAPLSVVADLALAVPMRDGIALRADVYRPSNRAPCAAILLRTPYDRTQGAAFGQQINVRRFVAAGYAVVIQDVRGRFGSEGDFYPFVHEGRDGADTIEWMKNQSWCDGRIGLAGTSYAGYCQVRAAREAPEAFQAYIPAFTPCDARTGWVYEGGAFCLGFNLTWALGSIASADRRTSDALRLLHALADWDTLIRRAPHDQPELASTPAGDFYFDWLDQAGDETYWERCTGYGAGRSSAPALVIGGWFDVFAKGTVDVYTHLHEGRVGGKTHLVVGPWDHSPLPLQRTSGETDFGPAAAFDLTEAQQLWFDWLLRGESEPAWPAVQVFVTGWNRWEGMERWPADFTPTSWYLHAGGALTDTPGSSFHAPFPVSADDPTPTIGGQLCCWPVRLRPGQLDQLPRERRPDVLSYTSEPVVKETLFLGPALAEIWSTGPPKGSDIFVTLTNVAPDGRSFNLAEGICRRMTRGEEVKLFEVDLGHIAHVLLPGHRIRIDVAAMSFPRFDRRPLYGEAHREVLGGGDAASRLVLPVAL